MSKEVSLSIYIGQHEQVRKYMYLYKAWHQRKYGLLYQA